MPAQGKKPTNPLIHVRIDPATLAKVEARAEENGRTPQQEFVRLVSRAMDVDQMLGTRADGAFDLAMCFSSGGARAVVKELMDRHGVTIGDLAAWSQSGKPA